MGLVTLFQYLLSLIAVVIAIGGSAPIATGDTLRNQQWYLAALDIDEAHEKSMGQGVLVAVIDSGVDANHPELSGRVEPGIDLSGASKDGRSDPNGHGTSMASLIAASDDTGMIGIAPQAHILPIRITINEQTTTNQVARGIRLAVEHGATVINISLSTEGASHHELQEAVTYANKKGAVVIAAAGNTTGLHGSAEIQNPADIPGVVAVTGLDENGQFWSGSSQGAVAVIAAPAKGLLVALPRHVSVSGYGWSDGTSGAAAIVSGIAALIQARYPELSPAALVEQLTNSADDLGSVGRDPQYGYGKVNPVRALITETVVAAASASQPLSVSTSLGENAVSFSPTAAMGSQYFSDHKAIIVLAFLSASTMFGLVLLRRWRNV